MQILPINSISFNNAGEKTTDKKVITNPVKSETSIIEKNKHNDILSYTALGAVLFVGAVMLYRTGSSRIRDIASQSSHSDFLDIGGTPLRIRNLKDDNSIKSLSELSGLEPLKDFCREYLTLKNNPEAAKEHKIDQFSSLLFWGVPGTGKTTGAMGFAKEIGADFIKIDKEHFASMFVSEDSRKLKEIIMRIYEHATTNSDRPIVVFMDEFDATIAIDNSNQAKHSNDLVDTLKLGITYLQQRCHNIIFIGATNKDPNGIKSDHKALELNPAILDRCKYIIEFKLPQIDEIDETWQILTKTASGKDKFTKEESRKIAEIFFQLGTSYRDIESTADKMNRSDAVESCGIKKSYNSKINLINAMLNDEKIGYNPITKKSLPQDQILVLIKELKTYFNILE